MRLVLRHTAALVLALAAAGGAALCWPKMTSFVDVPPIADGQPATLSTVYHPPVMLLVLLLATTAGILAVLAVSGMRRGKLLPTP